MLTVEQRKSEEDTDKKIQAFINDQFTELSLKDKANQSIKDQIQHEFSKKEDTPDPKTATFNFDEMPPKQGATEEFQFQF